MTADPGGNFASDAHRRVMASLAGPDDDYMDFDDLMVKVERDEQVDLDRDEVDGILQDLEADGDARQTQKGWRHTKTGHKALTGPIASDGGRAHD